MSGNPIPPPDTRPLTLSDVAGWLDGWAHAADGAGARFNAADYRACADVVRRWAPVVALAVAHEADGAGACWCEFCQAVRRARGEAVTP